MQDNEEGNKQTSGYLREAHGQIWQVGSSIDRVIACEVHYSVLVAVIDGFGLQELLSFDQPK
eukprot:3246040-Pyramimonas_sp.AAC.1